MRKSVKIILSVLAAVLIIAGVFAYNVYQSVMGSEDITGSQGEVPENLDKTPPLTFENDDWPNWRGKNFDGKSNTKNVAENFSKGLNKSWEVDYLCQGRSTATWSAPVVVGNRVIVPGRNETHDLVFCINSEDGSLIWKGEYPAETSSSHGPGARATPFIDSNKVYTYGRNGDLVCWNLYDGKKIWHKNALDEGGEEPDWGLSSTPLVYENKVIVQGGGKALVLAYEKNTGELLWKSLEGPSGYSAAVPVIIDENEYILVYHAMALSCLEPNNGKELWRVPWETDYGVNATTPVIDGNIVFHTSAYGKGGQAIEISKDKYKVLWKNNIFASHHSDPFILEGYIYGYSGESSRNKGDFKCIELKTGKEIWSTKEMGYGTSVYVDGHIICLDLKGNLFVVKPQPSGFEKVAEFENAIPDVKHLAWTAPVVANGKLYLRYLQYLMCFDLTKSS